MAGRDYESAEGSLGGETGETGPKHVRVPLLDGASRDTTRESYLFGSEVVLLLWCGGDVVVVVWCGGVVVVVWFSGVVVVVWRSGVVVVVVVLRSDGSISRSTMRPAAPSSTRSATARLSDHSRV